MLLCDVAERVAEVRPAELPVESMPVTAKTPWMEQAYAELQQQKHDGAIRQCARRMERRLPQNYATLDDLISEAQFWAVEAAMVFDGSRSSFITFLYHHLKIRARNFERKVRSDRVWHRRAKIEDTNAGSLENILTIPDETTSSICFDEFLDALTPESRLVLLLIIGSQDKLAKLGVYNPPRKMGIANFLELSIRSLNRAFKEIQLKYEAIC